MSQNRYLYLVKDLDINEKYNGQPYIGGKSTSELECILGRSPQNAYRVPRRFGADVWLTVVLKVSVLGQSDSFIFLSVVSETSYRLPSFSAGVT